MNFSYSTLELPNLQKVPFWQDAVCSHMIPADATAMNPYEFDASIFGHDLGDLAICQMKAPSHTFLRSNHLLRKKPDEDFVLVYVESGENGFEQASRTSLGGSGTVVLLDAARPFVHDFRASTIYTVKIPRRRLLARFPSAERLTGLNLNPGLASGLLPLLIKEGQAFADDQRGRKASERFNAVFIDSVALALEVLIGDDPAGDSRRNDVYRKATEFIEENFLDCDLDVKFIADAVFVSPRTLSRIFASHGETVMHYVWNVRLEKSFQMLSRGHVHNVTDAAFSAGFSDLSHFTKVFRKKFGMPPRSVLCGAR